MIYKTREAVPLDELNQMQRYLGEETIEDYQQGQMTRRRMLRRLVLICGSSAAAASLLAACGDATATLAPTTAAPTRAASTTAAATAAPTTAASTTAAATTAASTTRAATTAASAATTAAGTTSAAGTTAAAGGTTAAAGGTTVAGSPPPAPTPGQAKGPLTVAATDPAIEGTEVSFPSDGTTVSGYLARPKAPGTYPGVIVIHENRGLNDHIRDVARRLAKEGYIALAPDLVSRGGGTTSLGFDRVPAFLSQAKPDDLVKDLNAGVAYLEKQTGIKPDKFGVTGFCFGGAYTMRLAATNPKIAAAVPYYGVTPEPASQMSATNAAILAQYGGTDARVNATIPALEQAMAGKTFQKKLYDGAGHAFNNDTGGSFNEKVAVDAWKETLGWFSKYLKS